MMSLNWRNAFPETAKEWAIRNANVIRASVIFGLWVIPFLMLLASVGMLFKDCYLLACIAALGVTLHMKQSAHPHLAGGKGNKNLESDEKMEDRQDRWLHDALIQYFCFGVYMAPWVAIWIYANWLPLLLSHL